MEWGLIIVVLLTYSIVLNPSPFSLTKAAEKIGKDLHLPRHYPNWHKFTDEEKFACLVTYVLRHREDLAPSPEPEERVERGNSRLILEEPQEVDFDKEPRRSGRLNDGDSQGAVTRKRVSIAAPDSGGIQVITIDTETSV